MRFKKGTEGWIMQENRAVYGKAIQQLKALRVPHGQRTVTESAVRLLEDVYTSFGVEMARQAEFYPQDLK